MSLISSVGSGQYPGCYSHESAIPTHSLQNAKHDGESGNEGVSLSLDIESKQLDETISKSILLIRGKGIFCGLEQSLLDKFELIGNTKEAIQLKDLEKDKKYSTAIVYGHGGYFSNRAMIELIDEEMSPTATTLTTLQQKLGVHHFHLFSCCSGWLTEDWEILKSKLLPGTTINIFSGKKYPTRYSACYGIVHTICSFYESHQSLPLKQIDRLLLESEFLISPLTFNRCEILKGKDGEKKFLSFRITGPKTAEDVHDFSHFIFNEKKMKPLIVEDFNRYHKLQKKAFQQREINLSNYGSLSLFASAIKGKMERLKAWLDVGIDPNVSVQGRTPLLEACAEGKVDCIRTLVQQGADLELKTCGSTPLWIECSKGIFERNNCVANLLIELKANVDAVDINGTTLLMIAIVKGHDDIAQKLLGAGVNINAQNIFESTALIHAASLGFGDRLVKLLIANKADVNLANKKGLTALGMACSQGRPESTEQLLEAGSNTKLKDKLGRTPLHLAAFNTNTHSSEHIRHLLNKNADIEATDNNGCTALATACGRNNLKAAELLVEKGANVNAIAKEYCVPILTQAIAQRNDPSQVVQLLLEASANINAITTGGVTALHIACVQGHTNVVQMLIDKKGDIEAKDNQGVTMLQLAVLKGNQAIVQLLKNGGVST